MSTPLACPRCGYQNDPGYQFCTNCGAPIGAAAVSPSEAALPGFPGPVASGGPMPPTNYDRTRQIDRTKTGVFLLLVGSLLSWAPYYISLIGDLLLFVGAIMVILGRKAFGPAHSRNVLASIVLFAVGVLVVIVVALVALIPSLPSLVSTGGVLTPAGLAASQNAGLVGAIAAALIIGIAEVLFTSALQLPKGRLLLWAGYGANLAVSLAVYAIMSPVYNAVVIQADFDSALSMQLIYSLFSVVPALLFAAADYLAWSRISRGEIPAVPAAPGMPTFAAPPLRPPPAPPSGPAPPINPE